MAKTNLPDHRKLLDSRLSSRKFFNVHPGKPNRPGDSGLFVVHHAIRFAGEKTTVQILGHTVYFHGKLLMLPEKSFMDGQIGLG